MYRISAFRSSLNMCLFTRTVSRPLAKNMSFSKLLKETNPEKPDLDSLRFGLATTVAFSAIGKVHIATVQALPISILPCHPAGWCLRWFNCVGKTCFYQPFSFFLTQVETCLNSGRLKMLLFFQMNNF